MDAVVADQTAVGHEDRQIRDDVAKRCRRHRNRTPSMRGRTPSRRPPRSDASYTTTPLRRDVLLVVSTNARRTSLRVDSPSVTETAAANSVCVSAVCSTSLARSDSDVVERVEVDRIEHPADNALEVFASFLREVGALLLLESQMVDVVETVPAQRYFDVSDRGTHVPLLAEVLDPARRWVKRVLGVVLTAKRTVPGHISNMVFETIGNSSTAVADGVSQALTSSRSVRQSGPRLVVSPKSASSRFRRRGTVPGTAVPSISRTCDSSPTRRRFEPTCYRNVRPYLRRTSR